MRTPFWVFFLYPIFFQKFILQWLCKIQQRGACIMSPSIVFWLEIILIHQFTTLQNPADTGIIITNLSLENVKSVSTERCFPFLAGRPRRPVCAGARSYMTESILALPIRSRFGYSSTMDTRFFFLPHTIARRNGKIRYFIPIPDRYAEHDTHKAVSIQIVGTVVCSMVKQF